MVATGIHSLQGFHIHYGMYVLARRLVIFLLFFSLFYRISQHTRKIKGRQFKEENFNNQKQSFLTNLEHKVSTSFQGKQKGSFGHAWGFQVRLCFMIFYLCILVLNIISFGLYSKLSLFQPIRHCFSIRLVLINYQI